MNDREIDQLLRKLEPGGKPGLEGALREAGQELLEEIMSSAEKSGIDSEEAPFVPVRLNKKSSAGRRTLLGVGAAAAAAVAIVIPTLILGGGRAVPPASPEAPPASLSPSPSPGPALVPTTNPHVLLDAPGWKIDYVNETDWGRGVYGQLRYVKDDAEIEISWSPPGEYKGRVRDREAEYGEPMPFTLFGEKAVVFKESSGEFEAMAKTGQAFLSARSSGVSDFQTFRRRLTDFSAVTPEQWFAGMPDSVVTPPESTAVAAQIISDIPLPPGFDTMIFSSRLTNSYHQFGAGVTGRITCAWLDDYTEAYDARDQKGMAAVDQALSGAADWAFIKWSSRSSGWDQAVLDYTGRVADRKPVSGYDAGLGCDAFADS